MPGDVRRYGWVVIALALPGMLLYSSVRTFRELDRMKEVYLRNRAAAIAARLETVTSDARVAEDEPALLDLKVYDAPEAGPDAAVLEAIWRGTELFHTSETTVDGRAAFRAYVPFHRGGRMLVGRIDLDRKAADFLVVHARHNIVIAAVSGLTVLSMAAFALWMMRRRAAEERNQLELAHLAHLGKMAAVLAHEIRNPLGTMKGFAQLALEKADSNSNTATLLQPVVKEAERLEALVSDLLLYGRPPEPAVRRVAWSEVRERLASAARDSRVSIEEATVAFDTDPNLLHHILTNLVRNALDATSGTPAGSVRVRIGTDAQEITIVVEDNGPGMQREVSNRALEAFFTTKPLGTGLGLPIANNLTKSLGGRLTLTNGPGGGVCARVTLPCEFSRAVAVGQTVWK